MAIHQDLAPDMHLPELSCRHSAFDLPMRLVQHFPLAGHELSFCDLNLHRFVQTGETCLSVAEKSNLLASPLSQQSGLIQLDQLSVGKWQKEPTE